jgi:hypothetical protein
MSTMDSHENEWRQSGRVEFHLNGGFTRISLWMGGRFFIDLRTDEIPDELRRIGTWIVLRMDAKRWFVVEGPGEPEPRYEEWLEKQKDL